MPGDGTYPHHSFADFLQRVPPGSTVTVEGAFVSRSGSDRRFAFPTLTLHCESATCDGPRQFRHAEPSLDMAAKPVKQGEWVYEWVRYVCRNCGSREKMFGLAVKGTGDGFALAYKVGEMPAFGSQLPSKLISLLREERELLIKGKRAESQGMGVGAFTYYRRVVELQRARLFDEIEKVARAVGREDLIEKIEAAKKETRFKASLELVKDAIPKELYLSGENPFVLLFGSLSTGIHGWSDEQCLATATAIREVLSTFALRAQEVLQERAQLESAIKVLKQIPHSEPVAENEGDESESIFKE